MGKTVTLVSSSENAQITPAATPDVTDTNGRATFQVSDGTAEMVTFTATDASDAIQITTPVVVTFAQPTASASKSVVNGSALAAPSDGVTSVAITVTVMDQFGHPLSGKAVTLTGSPATTTRVAPQTESTSIPAGITDANGKAVFFVYDTAAETVVYTATDTTDNVVIDQTASVTYGAGLPQVNNSTLSANPTSVPADGTTSSTVTVGLEDHNSNPVPGKTITLTATGGSSTITPVSPMTDSKGDATFKVTDTTSEVVFYTASDTSDSLPLAGQGVTVTFGTPPPILPAIADSTIVAEPSQVPADGSTNSTITVVLADADGNVVSGRTVALNPANGSSSVTTVTGVTDVNGEATFTVTDKDAEKVTYTATDVTDSLPIAGQSVAVVFTSTGTATTTTTTTSSTTTTTTSGQSSTSTTTSVPAAIVSTASSSGASGSGDSTTGGSTGTGLAFTGAPDLWPWMVGLGGLLIFMGAVGRRALRPHDSR
jgi:hypothetical protein